MNIIKITLSVVSLSSLFFVAGCETPSDALNGYSIDPTHTRYIDHPLDKAILDDVQKFISSKKIPPSDIMETTYGEDKNGRHVVFIVQKMPSPRDSDFRSYMLFYDKNNVRTKVKSWSGHSSC